MTLKQIKDAFKETFAWKDAISIGKIDKNAEKAICFYPSKRDSGFQGTIGGNKNKHYDMKKVTILLRYAQNQDEAEIMAQKVYDFLLERSFFIEEKRVFTIMKCDEPIWLGTDDKNVYEYSFELDFYKER